MKQILEIDEYGTKEWKLNGLFHREDGPGNECHEGTKYWCINGKLHREDGPAIEYNYGSKEWFINGKRHRVDGPAIEWVNDAAYWFVNDENITTAIIKDIEDGILRPYDQWTESDRIKFKLKYS